MLAVVVLGKSGSQQLQIPLLKIVFVSFVSHKLGLFNVAYYCYDSRFGLVKGRTGLHKKCAQPCQRHRWCMQLLISLLETEFVVQSLVFSQSQFRLISILNPRPFACEANVITNYTTKPCHPALI